MKETFIEFIVIPIVAVMFGVVLALLPIVKDARQRISALESAPPFDWNCKGEKHWVPIPPTEICRDKETGKQFKCAMLECVEEL